MPNPPDTSMLVTSIREVGTKDRHEKRKDIDRVHSAAEIAAVKQWWNELRPFFESVENLELREWISLAFLGACVGFTERNLHPGHPEHQYLYPKFVEEITAVFLQLEGESGYDLEDIQFELYDYGIKCVYHLDWNLYMSKEFY
ncbi:MAG: hypothetical protein HQM13_04255 [SAR324 cluster bacterium]|nr:hypothetical protein [SAR324 cluster bacterium]